MKIPWLKEEINKKYKQMKFDRNRNILIEIIRWIFQDIIIPLIRSNFYVTEKHNEGSKIFYYRLNFINKLLLFKIIIFFKGNQFGVLFQNFLYINLRKKI